MTVYIDLVFLQNFFLDFFVIYSASRLCGAGLSLVRLLTASALGGMYACLAIVLQPLRWIAIKILFALTLSLVAYGFKSLHSYVRQSLLFLMCSAILGGIVFIFAFTFGSVSVLEDGNVYYSLPFWAMLLGILCCTGICIVSAYEIRLKPHKKIVDGEIFIYDKKIRIRALFDSGNLCVDASSGFPVIICDANFPEMCGKKILYKTSSGAGEMKIIIPDQVIIYDGIFLYKSREAAIGITDRVLDSSGSFNALIGGMYFERAVKTPERAYRNAFFR